MENDTAQEVFDDGDNIWEFIYQKVVVEKKYTTTSKKLFSDYIELNEKDWEVDDLSESFLRELSPNLHKSFLETRKILQLFKCLRLKFTDEIMKFIERQVCVKLRVRNEILFDFQFPDQPPHSMLNSVFRIDEKMEMTMYSYVEKFYGTVPNSEFTLNSFWTQFAISQNLQASSGFEFAQHFLKMLKTIHLSKINLNMKMRLMKDLKFKMTEEAAKSLSTLFNVEVDVDDDNFIKNWRVRNRNSGENIRRARTIESNDDDDETSSRDELPARYRKIKAWKPRSPDNDDDEKRVDSPGCSTPPTPPRSITHLKRNTRQKSESNQEDEMDIKYTKMVSSRKKFEINDQVEMARFLHETILKSKTTQVQPNGISIWKAFVKSGRSSRDPVNLSSHYRKVLQHSLYTLPMGRDVILDLYKNLKIKTDDKKRNEIENLFNVVIKHVEGYVVSWDIQKEDSPAKKRVRTYSSSPKPSKKSKRTSVPNNVGEKEKMLKNNESGFESTSSGPSSPVKRRKESDDQELEEEPVENVENCDNKDGSIYLSDVEESNEREIEIEGLEEVVEVGNTNYEQEMMQVNEEEVAEQENQHQINLKFTPNENLDETMSLPNELESEIFDDMEDNMMENVEQKHDEIDNPNEIPNSTNQMKNENSPERSLHIDANSTGDGELKVAICEDESMISNEENSSETKRLRDMRAKGKSILVDNGEKSIPLIVQNHFKKEIEEVLEMADKFSGGDEIMSSALTDTTNKMNAEANVEVENGKTVVQEVVAETTEKIVVDEPTEEVAAATEEVAVESTEPTATESIEEATAELKEEVAMESTEQTPAESTEQVTAESNEEVSTESTEKVVATSDDKVETETTEQNSAPTVVESKTSTEENVELTKEQKTEEMKKHLTAGRRLLLTNEFNKATDILSLASQFAGEVFGDDSEHSFEPFFYYAQALLELAKVEDQVFSNALSNIPIQEEDETTANDSIDEEQYGNPEKLTEEEREEIKQQVEEALETGAEGETDGSKPAEAVVEVEVPTSDTATEVAPASAETETETNTDDAAESAETKTTEEVTTADANEDGDVDMEVEEGEAGGEEEGGEENEDDDDESSMKLAWELFEASRRICDKKLESLAEDALEDLKKWTLLKADVLGFLGEHGIVDGKAEQAQKDLMAALELQTKHHGETSRVLAQTNHLLAKAFRLDGGFEDAAAHFEKSKKFLVARSDELKTRLEAEVDEARKAIEEELKELTELIPEMDVFIDDSKASAEQAAKIKESVKEELASAAAVLKNLTGSGDSTEAVKDANDISGMIRRPAKRQASPQTTEDEGDNAKKAKCDESSTNATSAETTTEEAS